MSPMPIISSLFHSWPHLSTGFDADAQQSIAELSPDVADSAPSALPEYGRWPEDGGAHLPYYPAPPMHAIPDTEPGKPMPGLSVLTTHDGGPGADIFIANPGTPSPTERGPEVVEIPQKGDWLKFMDISKLIQHTDLPSREWVAEKSWDPTKKYECSSNLSLPGMPFYHPEFIFYSPTPAVRLRLKAMHEGPEDGKTLWDVIFAGRPGNDFTVPHNAAPAGGMQPLFPQFCQPLAQDAMYELRVTDATRRYPRFDERLILKPKGSLAHHCEGYCPEGPPRPPISVQSVVEGAPVMPGIEEVDPETGKFEIAEGNMGAALLSTFALSRSARVPSRHSELLARNFL